LIELSASGGPDLRPWLEEVLTGATEQDLVQGGLIAQSVAQAASFWRIRELMVEAQQKRGTHLRTDVAVPISAIGPFVADVTKALTLALPGLLVVSYGHVGDGNVHVNALPPQGMTEASFRSWLGPLTEKVNDVVDRFGGSISAEHGIGLSKREALARRLPEKHRQLMRTIKDVMDPHELLAPGRILASAKFTQSL